MKNFINILQLIKIIVQKDFIEEIKSKEILISIISYSTLVLVVVATTSNIKNSSEIFSIIFWISLSFSIILGINKSMSKEFENNGLEMILTSPIDIEIFIINDQNKTFKSEINKDKKNENSKNQIKFRLLSLNDILVMNI